MGGGSGGVVIFLLLVFVREFVIEFNGEWSVSIDTTKRLDA